MASFTQMSPIESVRPYLPLYSPNAPTRLTLLIQSPSHIQSAVLIVKLPTTQSSAVNCFPILLSHKYLPQPSILKRPQCMFLTQYNAASLTPIYKQENSISIYINFYVFLIKKNIGKLEMK
jgi:hypothetical protein